MLIDIDDLRVKVGLASGDASQDAAITTAYDAALDMIEAYLNRKLEFMADQEHFTHINGYTASLRRYPVTSVASVRPDAKYHVERETGVLHFDGRVREHDLTVDYSGGFTPTTLPAVIHLALLDTFKAIWDAAQGGGGQTGEIQSITAPDVGTIRFATSGGAAAAGSAGSTGGLIPAYLLGMLSLFRREWA